MSQPRFIFNTLGYQNSAITVNNYVNDYNAKNNAAATGNSFKFQTDADRMKYLIGANGQPRVSGYYPGLYASLFALTVVQNGSTLPSINGPGGTGWGSQLWAGPITDAVIIGDAFLTQRTGRGDYVGARLAGYIYSPVSTTITFETISDDGAAIYLNGELVLNAWAYQGPTKTTSAVLTLNVGYNPITILYFEGGGSSELRFTYRIGTGPAVNSLSCDCVYNYNQL
jgi:hypothetical protein